MDIRTFDLNLLRVFDALYAERHVTRAGLRVGLSQSATSGALTRLREVFEDELFVRDPAGMQPTPRAHDLAGPISDAHGVEVRHAWGMTELSPIGTVAAPNPPIARSSAKERKRSLLKQGRAPIGVELTLKDERDEIVPRDGATTGRLMVRGFAVAGAYYRHDASILDGDGLFDTGDLATIDADNMMRIADRAKDLVKSGGEWISSIEIETLVVGHPDVANAAVIAKSDPRWGERPLLIVQLKPGRMPDVPALLAHLKGRIARWWVPDEVVFVEEIVLGSTGKVEKKLLRERYGRLVGSGDS